MATGDAITRQRYGYRFRHVDGGARACRYCDVAVGDRWLVARHQRCYPAYSPHGHCFLLGSHVDNCCQMRPGGVIDIEVKAACAVCLVDRAGDELIR